MIDKAWKIRQCDEAIVNKISEIFKFNPITARILANRGIQTVKAAHAFLYPSLRDLKSPSQIKDMDKAVERIYQAIKNHESILIFGDYDVDGITSTTILFEFLKSVGANVDYYIPHRKIEGYGLRKRHITGYACSKKIHLIITVDCGTSSHNAIEAANQHGIDVIVTDHHNVPSNLPKAIAVINPKRLDCSSGLDNLSGVGVAFYLLISLRKLMRDDNYFKGEQPNLKKSCDMVGLGSIADLVPIVDENRIFVKTGLEVLNESERPGIKALIEVSGIKNDFVDAEDIAFRLAPRLNAAGRMTHAKASMRLLTTHNEKAAKRIARLLNKMNLKRQDIETKINVQIQALLDKKPELLNRKSIVLAREGWHEGVLGIAASRLLDRYYRPVILIGIKNGIGKGSCRSIPGFNIYDALVHCSRHLVSFGGHATAAGVKIKKENIAQFADSLDELVREKTQPSDFIPTLSVDCELTFDLIDKTLIDELSSLHPFGWGNPEPLFFARNIKVIKSNLINHQHRRMILKQPHLRNNNTFYAIWFNVESEMMNINDFNHIAFRLRWNNWNGRRFAQIIIEDAKPK